jgi:predicted metal-dependent hydrolase
MKTYPKHPYILELDGLRIEVSPRPVKQLRLTVNDRQGKISAVAPLQLSEQYIRDIVQSKLPWIRKHLERYTQPVQANRPAYRNGALHLLEGKSYRLELIPDAESNRILLHGDRIELRTKPGASEQMAPTLLYALYRARLQPRAKRLLSEWQQKMGVRLSHWGIKLMKSRWGSCNSRARRVWLNLELAKHSDRHLEFIIVHELAHLLEPSHNARFKALMDSFIPDWRTRAEELKTTPPMW